MAIDTVLYDFDGTVMDTAPVIIASWQHTFRTLRGVEVEPEMLYQNFGEPLEVTVTKYFPEVPAQEAVDIYRSYHHDYFEDMIQLFPGMREAMAKVKALGVKTALVTSRLARTTHMGLTRFDLYRYLDDVITVEDCPKYKPDPGPALTALERLGSRPENTLLLGDTRFDMLCGQNAGVQTALVSWTHSLDPAHLPEDIHPTYILESPAMLPEIVAASRAE